MVVELNKGYAGYRNTFCCTKIKFSSNFMNMQQYTTVLNSYNRTYLDNIHVEIKLITILEAIT